MAKSKSTAKSKSAAKKPAAKGSSGAEKGQKTLFCVSGNRAVRISEVEAVVSSLNSGSCFLLDPRSAANGEEQMLMVRGDRVCDIARIPRGTYDRLGESVGFLKLEPGAAKLLRSLLAERVDAGDIGDADPATFGPFGVGEEHVECTVVDMAGDRQ